MSQSFSGSRTRAVSSEQKIYTDDSGHYEITDRFFSRNGIWKFRAYWEGNNDLTGCESNLLEIPMGVDFGRAIILAGGEANESNTLWEATRKLTVSAYRDFKERGFTDDMIHFMINSDIDINYDGNIDDVVDDKIPTAEGLTHAIKTAFASALDPEVPLFVYMQGHGTDDRRFKVLGDDEFVSGAELKAALDWLQAETGCQVIFILESCFSGEFIRDLSGTGRIILTSSGNEQYTTDRSVNIAFSRYLFSKLLEGDSFKKAFDYTASRMTDMNKPAPRLDDNGNGKPDAQDGLLAMNVRLGGNLDWGIRPKIDTISVNPVLGEGISTTPISADVIRGDRAVTRVWVQSIPPNSDITGDVITYQETELIFSNDSGQYEGRLASLDKPGIYRFVVSAKDADQKVSDPGVACVRVLGSGELGDVNGDGNVNLEDAVFVLRIVSGFNIGKENVVSDVDIDKNGKTGLEMVVFILQELAGLR